MRPREIVLCMPIAAETLRVNRWSDDMERPVRRSSDVAAPATHGPAVISIGRAYYPGMLFDAEEAAVYFHCSRSHFDEVIRPKLPWADHGRPGSKQPMPRWAIEDLQTYHTSIKRGVSN
jgi:hypothetical protein